MPRAIIYLRVSTDEQAESGLGLEAQLSACRAAADRQGLAIASIFQDDVSGGLPLDRRPVLVDAIATLEPGDILLIAKRDRLSRGDQFVTGTIELAIQRAGARILSASGEGTESDDPATS
jgi:DNA invertase Pin-like site-specific DNA recombinase